MKKEFVKVYKIKQGDSLNSIANKFFTNPMQILIENKISPKEIREGKLLLITSKN